MTITTSLATRAAGTPPSGLATTLAGAGPAAAAAAPGRAAGKGRATGAPHAASTLLPARTALADGPRASAGSAKATKAARTATPKAAAAKKKAGSTAGYAKTTLPAEFAFLRDPKLSVEEKLSRFIGLIMAKAEKDLLAQMEKMAPGSKTSAAGAAKTGTTAPKKKKGFSLWGALKVVLPQVGMASQFLGDAATKKLVQQLTGPVLAGAAAALGFPQLAPLALQAGSALGQLATDEGSGDTAAIGSALASLIGRASGGDAEAAVAAGTATATGASTAKAGASGTAAKGADEPRSEKADQLELQRLMEREKETFTLLSNILRMNHEARMVSVQNIR